MKIIIGRSNDGYSYVEQFFYKTYHQLEQLQIYTSKTYIIIEVQLETQLNTLIKKDQELHDIIIKRGNELIDLGEDNEIAFEIAADEYGGSNFYTEDIINQEIINNLTKDNFCKTNIILLYSFIESKILELCSILKINGNLSIEVSDLKGNNYIDKGVIYLEKLFNINNTELANYVFIKNYQRLRNKIVHNGIIKEKDKKFIEDSYNNFIKVNDNKIFVYSNLISSDLKDKIKCFLLEIELKLEEKLNFISLKTRLNDIFWDIENKSIYNINKTNNSIIISFDFEKNKLIYNIKIECLKTQKPNLESNNEIIDFENEINWRLDEIKKAIVYYLDTDVKLKKYYLKITIKNK